MPKKNKAKKDSQLSDTTSQSDYTSESDVVDQIQLRNASLVGKKSIVSDSEESSSEGKQGFKFTSDLDVSRRGRVEFASKYGTTYTRTPVEEEDKRPFTPQQKQTISKKKLHDMEVDPYLEFGQRAIQYTDEEQQQFHAFTSKVISGRKMQVKNYLKNTPNVFEKYTSELDELPTGEKNIHPLPNDFLTKRLHELSEDIWENPFCFVSGKMLTMLTLHEYTREIAKHIYGMLAAEIHERNLYTKDEIAFIFQKSGAVHVKETPVGDHPTIPEYIMFVFRFVNIKPEQHAEEEKMNATTHDDTSTLEWETVTSFMEDRLCLNVILIPEYNMNFRITGKTSTPTPPPQQQQQSSSSKKQKQKQNQKNATNDNKKDKKTNKKDEEDDYYDKNNNAVKDLSELMKPDQRKKLEANQKYVIGCIFYSI